MCVRNGPLRKLSRPSRPVSMSCLRQKSSLARRQRSPLRKVFELDDQFDSYSDAATLASMQYEMHLSERGQKVESVQRMTATGKEPASEDATQARVLPGTR